MFNAAGSGYCFNMILECDPEKPQRQTGCPDAKLLSAIIAAEPDAAVRDLISRLVEQCPAGQKHPHCPFFSLASLTETSLKNLPDPADRRRLLEQFARECECRKPASAAGPG